MRSQKGEQKKRKEKTAKGAYCTDIEYDILVLINGILLCAMVTFLIHINIHSFSTCLLTQKSQLKLLKIIRI